MIVEHLHNEFRPSPLDHSRYKARTVARAPGTEWLWAFGIFDPGTQLGAPSSTPPKLLLTEKVPRRTKTRGVSPFSAIRRIVAAIKLRRARSRSRRELPELSDRMLKDIGLRREVVGYEFPMPLWYRD
jgi:uncharacterized protein YjiS (DUF1127 family)